MSTWYNGIFLGWGMYDNLSGMGYSSTVAFRSDRILDHMLSYYLLIFAAFLCPPASFICCILCNHIMAHYANNGEVLPAWIGTP